MPPTAFVHLLDRLPGSPRTLPTASRTSRACEGAAAAATAPKRETRRLMMVVDALREAHCFVLFDDRILGIQYSKGKNIPHRPLLQLKRTRYL